MKTIKTRSAALVSLAILWVLTLSALAQVNSGSSGSDGAFNPTTNTIIDMADHPDGIYHYSSVNIPSGVTVTFLPNPANTPVVWLVQGDCSIAGTVKLDGIDRNTSNSPAGTAAGPGGWQGGYAALSPSVLPGEGLGPGGGHIGTELNYQGSHGSFATLGEQRTTSTAEGYTPQFTPGDLYGNQYCVPLLGGSGGSGGRDVGGGGGGGAFLMAASGTINISGQISARGSNGYYTAVNGWGYGGSGGAGSGGSIRLIATSVTGGGTLDASGGEALYSVWSNYPFGAGFSFNSAGAGRIRIDAFNMSYNGARNGDFSSGFQPIILPPPSQAVGLTIESVAGVAVGASPAASPTSPDVVVPGNTQNPVTIVVRCVNIPLNTEVIVDIKPANGPTVRGVAFNNSGTQSLSYATLQMNLPRGAGTIQAKAISGIADQFAAARPADSDTMLAQTGWLATGEGFKAIEITSVLGGGQSIAYIAESGKRYSMAQ